MSKCTIPSCGEPATHVVRWRNNIGQRFCWSHAKSVYDNDTNHATRLEKILKTTGKGTTT